VPPNGIAHEPSTNSSPYFCTHRLPLKQQSDSILYSSDDSISHLVPLSFWTWYSIHCLNIQESKAVFSKLDLIPSSDKSLEWMYSAGPVWWSCWLFFWY